MRSATASFFALTWLIAPAASAQEQRAVVFGEIGRAALGHNDSQQGRAPIFGGGAAFHLTPRIVIEGDVHGGRVEGVTGDRHHEFSELTITGSVLVRAPARGRVHFVTGGGFAVQRAHTVVTAPGVRGLDSIEQVRLLHGRIGADWDVSKRLVIRTDAVGWFGEGLDWVAGGRIGLGYKIGSAR